MKEDIFKKTEATLYQYKSLDVKIKNIQIDIENLENDITVKAVSYEEKVAPTNAFNSSVENEVIRREGYIKNQLETLRAKKKYYEDLQIKIESSLETLEDIEKQIVELRYFNRNRLRWDEVSAKVCLERNWCTQKKNKVIKKLAEMIYP